MAKHIAEREHDTEYWNLRAENKQLREALERINDQAHEIHALIDKGERDIANRIDWREEEQRMRDASLGPDEGERDER